MLSRRGGADQRHVPRADDGFTLIEFCTALTLFSILSAMAVVGLRTYSRAQAQNGTRSEIVSALRYAQTRSITEGTTYCVDFSAADSWSVYRISGLGSGALPVGFSCIANGTKIKGPFSAQSSVSLLSPSFAQRDGTNASWTLFYPRGSATPGSVTVVRSDDQSATRKKYVIEVEALTARVNVQ
jgi:prepilin-type N-terminal cleavage/methylation domain-containing protein